MGIAINSKGVHGVCSAEPLAGEIRYASELTYQSLLDLCQGKILALRIPDYYDASACQSVLEKLSAGNRLTDKYDNAPELDLYRLGMAFFETRFNQALLDDYFFGADEFKQAVEHLCFPHQSPLQQFVHDLKRVWPCGADLQQLNNQAMRPGLVRIFLENQTFPPHQDMLSRDYPELPKTQHPLSQLAINIYLQNFVEGGELELWDYVPDDEQVKHLYTGTHDFIDREQIPVPVTRLQPQAGELILAQCSKLHAVRPGKTGQRVAFSCFTAYRGEDQPLTYWV